jgi:hypothetical protein
MNSKIVGFILSPQKINYTPLLNPDLMVEDINVDGGVLSLYYYGALSHCCFNGREYSMGFPASQSLLTSNLLVSLNKENVEVKNDWLGSIPCFYNKTERIVSSFPTVCLKSNKVFDEDGLFLFLKYGFSVFGFTPFKEVQFLLFNGKITYSSCEFSVVQLEDPVKDINQFAGTSEADIWAHIDRFMHSREQSTQGVVVLPTSGGFDSRVLNCFVHEKSRVQTFSYGISKQQSNSFEVIEAKKLAQKLGHPWQQIVLGKAFDYIPEWHNLFAFSTHLHGMYHVEFYKKIKDLIGTGDMTLCSGICGGYIAGSIPYNMVSSATGLYSLALTHGNNYQPNGWQEPSAAEEAFFDTYRYLFDDLRFYPIINMRLKLMLLHYLMTVPSMMGIPAWTPYLDYDLAMMMLNLPPTRRTNRQWMRDFCQEKGIMPQKNVFQHDTKNRLNYTFHLNHQFDPLNVDFQSPFVSQDRVRKINNILGENSISTQMNYRLMTTRFIKEIARKFEFENKFETSLVAYETLMALKMSLIKK